MAFLSPISRRGLIGSLAVAALLVAGAPAIAAGIAREPIQWRAKGGLEGGDPSGTLTLNLPEVRQGSTLLRAAKASATGIEQSADNSTWELTGDVHLEFDGTVLDAHTATAVFANGQLSSVVVQASTTQPQQPVRVQIKDATLDVDSASIALSGGRVATVQARGGPARFSHLLKKNGRRANGRANRLDYDAGKNEITLSVDTSFSSGNHNFQTQKVVYNLADGTYVAPEAASGSSQLNERVPAPRTPDRATAK
jgi:lipopolysaccharide transport protein LptA